MPRLRIKEIIGYKLKSWLYSLKFTLSQMRSRRSPEICITDIDYADDISVITYSVNAAMTLKLKRNQAILV